MMFTDTNLLWFICGISAYMVATLSELIYKEGFEDEN